MTDPIEAVRSVLGPYTSEAKARAVVLAVLGSVREPGDGVKLAGAVVEGFAGDEMYPGEIGYYTAGDAWQAMIDALISELER